MNESFDAIAHIISSRRTVKPQQMNGQKIPDEQIKSLLKLADWAPTHGNTEPWRFVVYAHDDVRDFCKQHADMYRMNTTSFLQANYDKLLHMGDHASHIVIAIMQRGNLPKIPVLEEIASTACAVQNMLLGAQALGLAAYWGSGGMALHPSMKNFLQVSEDDLVMGILYFGYSNANPKGVRNIPLGDKVIWNG